MPTIDSLYIQNQAEQPVWLAINPSMLEAWLEPPLGGVLRAVAKPFTWVESVTSSIDESLETQ